MNPTRLERINQMTDSDSLCSAHRPRIALIGWALAAGLLAVSHPSQAQTTAPTIVGSLANFDAVNDSEGEKEGFEIQLEGLEANDITRVFGQSGATCYIRYCIGSITPYGTPGVAPFGVYVRWQANYNAATQTFTTPPSAPGNGHGTPSRVGNTSPMPVTGEACWSLGAGAAYAESGCEHFGVSTTAGRFPLAVKTVTYRWLVADPASPGNLIAASPTVVPPVPISHPVVQGAVVAGAPDVQVAAPAAPPVAPAHRYGKAEWVKVYKTELDRDADLDELVGGHPNNVVPNGDNHLGSTETEWKLLQLDTKNPDKGSSNLVSHGSPGGGKHAIVRRYEFYKYTGPVVAPGGTSGGGKGGGPVLSTDDLEQSLWRPRQRRVHRAGAWRGRRLHRCADGRAESRQPDHAADFLAGADVDRLRHGARHGTAQRHRERQRLAGGRRLHVYAAARHAAASRPAHDAGRLRPR